MLNILTAQSISNRGIERTGRKPLLVWHLYFFIFKHLLLFFRPLSSLSPLLPSLLVLHCPSPCFFFSTSLSFSLLTPCAAVYFLSGFNILPLRFQRCIICYKMKPFLKDTASLICHFSHRNAGCPCCC